MKEIIIIGIVLVLSAILLISQQSVDAFVSKIIEFRKAPIATSGDNVYIVWFTDKGTPNSNGEVIFRASNDGGAIFGDKINLSNTNDTDSINAEISTAGDNSVIVTWWERANATSNEPVARISTDNGQTFGPLLKLATNGTIGSNESGDD